MPDYEGYLDDHRDAELVATAQQLKTLHYTSHGLRERECAEAMGITVDGVKTNLTRARRNLRAKNTAHAVAIALRLGLID